MTDQKTKAPRRDKGPRITDRDMDALQWIAEQYAICMDHLQVLLARLRVPEEDQGPDLKQEGTLTEKRALKIVRRWEQLGLVERQHILYNQPQWVYLTNQGLKLVQDQTGELRPYTPQPARLNHFYWVNYARLYIEHKRPGITWTSERELRASQGKTEQGKKQPHTPDALVILENGNHIAIEIELSSKSYSRLDKILTEMASSNYHTIWYFCKGRAENVINNAVKNLHETYRSKIVVYKLDGMTLQ